MYVEWAGEEESGLIPGIMRLGLVMKRILYVMVMGTLVAVGAEVPRTWTEAAVKAAEVPLAKPSYSPVHISEQAYYATPVRTIYKTYPVYHPKREPAGYMEWL